MICLDKNHPPPIIQKTVDTIESALNKSQREKIELMKIALVPNQPNPHRGYPFSLSMLV